MIAAPSRGFFVIVPPEYRRLGCLPAEQFVPQLMETLGLTYYVGLLSAAQYHGAAHHRPQEFQVMVAKNRRPIACGEVRVGFVAHKAVEQVPTVTLNTPRGALRISTPEATALDLVGYPEHVGGIENAATVIAELIENLDGEKLLEAARMAKLPWIQRLGYLLEHLGQKALVEPLAQLVRAEVTEYTSLVTGEADASHEPVRDRRWRLWVDPHLEGEA